MSANTAIETLVSNIKNKAGCAFRPANNVGLKQLRELGLPESIIQFYSNSEPAGIIEIGDVRLLPISDIVYENTKLAPGIYIAPHGIVVLATTGSGDVYCFDRNRASADGQPAFVLMPHDIDFEAMKKDEVYDYAYEVAVGLEDFLEKFLTVRLEIEPK